MSTVRKTVVLTSEHVIADVVEIKHTQHMRTRAYVHKDSICYRNIAVEQLLDACKREERKSE